MMSHLMEMKKIKQDLIVQGKACDVDTVVQINFENKVTEKRE